MKPNLKVVTDLDRPLEDIIRGITLSMLERLEVRCLECGMFFDPRETNLVGCGVCFNGVFSFCDECGGYERALRSARAHVRWFASRPARRRYGLAHADAVNTFRRIARVPRIVR